MQMLAAYNVLANDGVYVPPRLVLETVDARRRRQPVEPGEARRIVSSTTAAQMREMLVNVVTEGTGSAAASTGLRRRRQDGHRPQAPARRWVPRTRPAFRYVATFTGFVPAERPELSIIVAIDEPSGDIYGGSVAAPVFADLAQYALRLLKIPPVLVERAPAPDTAAALAVEEGLVEPGAVGGDRDASGERARARAAPAAAPERAPTERPRLAGGDPRGRCSAACPARAPTATTTAAEAVAAGAVALLVRAPLGARRAELRGRRPVPRWARPRPRSTTTRHGPSGSSGHRHQRQDHHDPPPRRRARGGRSPDRRHRHPLGARTTPEAPDLQRPAGRPRDAGRQAVAMEVSSHALALTGSTGSASRWPSSPT
jgi:membrane peptidoglycan carboxypeptidase